MQTTTIQSTSLHYREGNSDKVYHAAVEPKADGYIVTFAYGRHGNTLATGIKNETPVPLETATKLFNKLVASKVAKGYQPDGETTKPYQQSGDEGRDSGIRCQLLNPIEKDELSRLLTGRTHCLQEKHDGRRLMIRKQGDTITGIIRSAQRLLSLQVLRLASLPACSPATKQPKNPINKTNNQPRTS